MAADNETAQAIKVLMEQEEYDIKVLIDLPSPNVLGYEFSFEKEVGQKAHFVDDLHRMSHEQSTDIASINASLERLENNDEN